MNSVSWFLYLSNVATNLSILGLICGVAVLMTAFVVILNHGMMENELHPRWWVFVVSAFIAFLFPTLIPSKETFYMIAASQIGEQIIQLEEVQQIGGEAGGLAKDAIDLLRQQIQEQLIEKPAEGS